MLEEKIENLISKYEKYLSMDNDKKLDKYRKDEHDGLLAVVLDLKEILDKNA